LREADGGVLGHPQRAAEVEIAFGRYRAGLEWNGPPSASRGAGPAL
jgi:hypothetical protein